MAVALITGASSGLGEAAARRLAREPALALVLTGLGVTSLSMSPAAVPDVRDALAAHTLEECRELARAALDADLDEGAAGA